MKNILNDLYLEESLSLLEYQSNINLNEALEFVNEAYIGKTDTLQQIEDQINIIRGNLNRFQEFDRLPEVQKLNRLFEKQFGMNIFALHMVPDNIINAYTQVIACNFDVYKRKDLNSYLLADRKDGYRFKPGNDFCVVAYVYWGLLSNPDFTDGEILSIILHEIGHNFADFVDNNIRFANQCEMDIYVAVTIINIIINAISLNPLGVISNIKDLTKSVIDMNNARKSRIENKNKRAPKRVISPTAKGTLSVVGGFFQVCANVLLKTNVLFIGFVGLQKLFRAPFEDSLKDQTKRSSDRRNEIIADKFAAIYGYGPELGSALKKFDLVKSKDEEIIGKIPIFGKKINDTWDKLYLDINEFDCHPHQIQRINECIKTLEDELNQKDMDPKLKAAIIKQIKEMKANIEDSKRTVNKNPMNIKAAYDAYVANELPDATTKSIEDEINKELNDVLRECKVDGSGQIIEESSTFNKALMGFRIHPHQNLEETLKKHEYQGYLNFINKIKDPDDLKYLRTDVWQGIHTIEKIKEIIADDGSKYKNRDKNKYVKAGITVKDCELTVKWSKEVLLETIKTRLKELK